MGDYWNLEDVRKLKGVSFLHLNIRSTFNKFDLFRNDYLTDAFDIVGVSETWLKPGLPSSLFACSNYNLLRKDRQDEAYNKTVKGDGLCLYIKEGIDYVEICLDENQTSSKDIEWICVKLNIGGNKPQILLLVYRPPSGNSKSAIDFIRRTLEFLNDKHKNCEHTIMGDLNFNYANKNCSSVKSLKMLKQMFNIEQVIKLPTRSTQNSCSVIDLCFTNMTNVSDHGVINYHLRDHCPIFVIKN